MMRGLKTSGYEEFLKYFTVVLERRKTQSMECGGNMVFFKYLKGFLLRRRVHLGYSPIEVTEISSTPDKEAPFKILNLPRHHTG